MLEAVYRNPWVQAAGLVLGLVLLALLAYSLSFVLVPLFFAFLVAYVLNPIVDWFERRRVPRGLTVGGLALVGVVLLLCIPLVLLPNVVSQARELAQGPVQVTENGDEKPDSGLAAWVDRALDAMPLEDFVVFVGWAESDQEDIDARAIILERIGRFVQSRAESLLQAAGPQATEAGAGAASGITSIFRSLGAAAMNFILALANFALFAFVSAYLLVDFRGIVRSAEGLLPRKHEGQVVDITQKMDGQLRGFLRGQLTVCLSLAVMYAIGFTISGVPFGIVIALLGGFVSFVPYVGPALTLVPALLLTLLNYGADWHVLGVIGTFVVAQALEGNVLTPNIVGSTIGLHPVWVILAVVVFSNLFGFVGLLLAVPIAAALKVLVVEGVQYYKDSQFYRERVVAPPHH